MNEKPELDPIQLENLEVRETRTLRRITVRGMLNEFVDAFNIDRGGIFTLKQLFRNPGSLVRDYISTGRLRYTPPMRMLVVTTTLVILVLSLIGAEEDFIAGMQQGGAENSERILEILSPLRNFVNLFLWLYIPITALFSYLFNRRSPFNYAENLVLHTYLYCMSNILTIALYSWSRGYEQLVTVIYVVLFTIYSVYAYRQFFRKAIGRSIIEMVLIFIVSTVIYALVSGLILLIYIMTQLGPPDLQT